MISEDRIRDRTVSNYGQEIVNKLVTYCSISGDLSFWLQFKLTVWPETEAE